MNRRLIEKLKIPESVRIPVLGGKIYRYLSKKENDLIQNETIENALNTKKEKKRSLRQ